MNKEVILNEKWIKASILGTIWAASEIVLGSFLHNLKVPFSGNVLTAIGIIILISVSYFWKEKGLFLRAGLICAIMKTMSPSAVIFGPMLAILAEATFLEVSVRIFGKTLIGYFIGGMLAMSWNLFQKIANYILFYGLNIVELYSNILKYAQKQLDLQFDILWLPILVLLSVYILFGLISAIIGIRIGRKIVKQPFQSQNAKLDSKELAPQPTNDGRFKHSIVWLFANLFFIIGSFLLLNFSFWYIWSLAISAVVITWSIRYKRALRQLMKPKFWLFFVLITMITSFVFTKVQVSENSVVDGLMIGIQMNFRALVIILGFSVFGTELYNPKIRAFFLKTSFKQLPLALEISFEMLPSMIAQIPNLKTIIKKPNFAFYQIIGFTELKLKEIKGSINFNQKLFILTGSIGQGKTTQIEKIIKIFKDQNIPIGGVFSPRIMEKNDTIGYDIVDIMSNEREVFLRELGDESYNKIGKFYIYPKGFNKGLNALNQLINFNNGIVIVDEVGNFELENNGWANSIQKLIDVPNNHILLVARDRFVEKIVQKWNIVQNNVYHISEMDYLSISQSIIKQLN